MKLAVTPATANLCNDRLLHLAVGISYGGEQMKTGQAGGLPWMFAATHLICKLNACNEWTRTDIHTV